MSRTGLESSGKNSLTNGIGRSWGTDDVFLEDFSSSSTSCSYGKQATSEAKGALGGGINGRRDLSIGVKCPLMSEKKVAISSVRS